MIISFAIGITGYSQSKLGEVAAVYVTTSDLDSSRAAYEKARVSKLKGQGLKNFTEMAGKNNQVLNTWKGQHFFLFSLGM